jgi:hypothetical protein
MMTMFSSKINYEENFSDAQYNPIDVDEEVEILFEMERGSVESGYED